MAQPSGGRGRGGEYALPVHAAKPRPHLDIGVLVVLITGLAAVALAGFATVASFFETGARPVPPAEPAAEATADTEQYQASLARETLRANPLYTSGQLASVTCPAPALDVDDPVSMEAFLHSVTDCLDKAWSVHFEDSELPFEPPNRIYWYTSGQSPCGNYPVEGSSAFYCHANKGLYLGVEDIVETSGHIGEAEAYTFLLSHEYGHHVQGESGILGQYQQSRGDSEAAGERDLWTRRSELQANCLGGVFLGSVADSFPIGEDERADVLEDAAMRADRGDVHTHGTPANGRMWTEHGMDRMDPASCNTWEAEEELVD
ncbi:neutral zinc metallopeptidase [Actinorugispora endophytica]|uniref:Metalloprotease n=1 Tax=Actinorugispora endophytica TaxID=1605990 RepID=A0A4R6V4R0_9ACTN|nr:neutral zinc metallopeptidase [Actinorugispora endophytica]TDQ55193.1 hypothetical protein EV190_101518 [Actinorugispora endophytica]